MPLFIRIKYFICTFYLILDYTVGRHEIKDFPNDKGNIRFGQTGMGLFLERFRRVLRLHPEFSNGLSDFDRSALWRSNYLLAGALTLAKVYKLKIILSIIVSYIPHFYASQC